MARSEQPQGGSYNHNAQRDWTSADRSFIPPLQDGRFAPSQSIQSSTHQRPQTIGAALKDCVGIPVKEFALIAIHENGDVKTYSSPALNPARHKIFSDAFKSTFSKAVRRVGSEASSQSQGFNQDVTYNEFVDFDTGVESGGRRSQPKSRSDHSDEEDSGSSKRRRGSRYHSGRYHSPDDNPTLVPVQKTDRLVIQNSDDVFKFYTLRFKEMQQSSCKIMGKAFVKLVEPKKQTHFPYTKGADAAPPWWPPTKGDEHVRHREPDHLLKPERIRLLVHILRLVVQPYQQQHPSIQKVQLNVKKLEENTNEAMSNWFNDSEHPENFCKKVLLKEIFKVAKMEERYLRGEIDGTTVVPVMHGNERPPIDVESEDEGDHEDDIDCDDANRGGPTPSMLTPESTVSPSMGQHSQLHPQEMEQRIRPLTHRYNTHPGHPAVGFDQNQYSEPFVSRNIQLDFNQTSNYQDRRPFPHEYQTSQHHNMMWPSQPMVFSPQTSLPPTTPSYQLPPLPHTPLTLGSFAPFQQHDSVNSGLRHEYAPVPNPSFRTGSIGHPHQIHHGFEHYMHDNQFVPHDTVLKEEDEHSHSHLQ